MPCMSIIQASYQQTEILRGGDHALPLESGGAYVERVLGMTDLTWAYTKI